jgi:hypothetical protein
MSRIKRPDFDPEPKEFVVDDKDFLEILKKGITKVVNSDKSTPKEIVDAVTAGSRLVIAKHKTVKGNKNGFFDD